jgi:hypothetical protein
VGVVHCLHAPSNLAAGAPIRTEEREQQKVKLPDVALIAPKCRKVLCMNLAFAYY